jgi:HPt (histidine-containing phosphotransfer) domain-containing protein
LQENNRVVGLGRETSLSEAGIMNPHSDVRGRGPQTRLSSWNRVAALENVGGDELLLDEMMQMFLLESPKLVAKIERALLVPELGTVELSAHNLGGQLGYLGVADASAIAHQLEIAARRGEMEPMFELFAALRKRLAATWAALDKSASR